MLPWIGNALFVFGVGPAPLLDLTPTGFTITSLAVAWGRFRDCWLDLVLVARDAIFEGMGDDLELPGVDLRMPTPASPGQVPKGLLGLSRVCYFVARTCRSGACAAGGARAAARDRRSERVGRRCTGSACHLPSPHM